MPTPEDKYLNLHVYKRVTVHVCVYSCVCIYSTLVYAACCVVCMYTMRVRVCDCVLTTTVYRLFVLFGLQSPDIL